MQKWKNWDSQQFCFSFVLKLNKGWAAQITSIQRIVNRIKGFKLWEQSQQGYLTLLGKKSVTVSCVMSGGYLVSLPPCLLTVQRSIPASLCSASLSPPVRLLLAAPPFFPPEEKVDKQQRLLSSLWSHQQSGERRNGSAGKEERENGECLVWMLISLRVLEVCVCVCVCACPEFSHRAQAHLALLDNTTGLLAPQEKKQNFPLLRIQS